MNKYNLKLKKSLVNIKRLFAIMWRRRWGQWGSSGGGGGRIVNGGGGCDYCLQQLIYYFIMLKAKIDPLMLDVL